MPLFEHVTNPLACRFAWIGGCNAWKDIKKREAGSSEGVLCLFSFICHAKREEHSTVPPLSERSRMG